MSFTASANEHTSVCNTLQVSQTIGFLTEADAIVPIQSVHNRLPHASRFTGPDLIQALLVADLALPPVPVSLILPSSVPSCIMHTPCNDDLASTPAADRSSLPASKIDFVLSPGTKHMCDLTIVLTQQQEQQPHLSSSDMGEEECSSRSYEVVAGTRLYTHRVILAAKSKVRFSPDL